MILPLRARHRIAVTTLAILLPVGVVLALSARRPMPVVASPPTTASVTDTGTVR